MSTLTTVGGVHAGMRAGPRTVLLLTIVAVAGGATAAPAGAGVGATDNASLPDNAPLPGEWRTLALDESRINRSETTSTSPDLGAVLAMRGDEIRTHHGGATLTSRTDVVGTDTAKFDLLDQEIQQISGRIGRLQGAEDRAIRAYDAGRIDGRTLLVRLARIQSQGNALENQLNDIRVAGRAIDSRALVARSDALATRLSTTDGPVRSRVTKTTAASDELGRIAVFSAGRDVAITSIAEDRYQREVSIPSRREGAGTVIQLPRAINIVAESYPEAYTNSRRIEDTVGGRTAGIYRITVVGGGELRAFVGIRSRQVFQEGRTVPLRVLRGQAPVGSTATVDGVRLTVSRTYRGGPLHVRTTEADSERPLDATVIVDGTGIGTTGSDGSRWTVASGGPTNVTAMTEGTEVQVRVTPTDPPALNRTVE